MDNYRMSHLIAFGAIATFAAAWLAPTEEILIGSLAFSFAMGAFATYIRFFDND
jgi:hypothetical protein